VAPHRAVESFTSSRPIAKVRRADAILLTGGNALVRRPLTAQSTFSARTIAIFLPQVVQFLSCPLALKFDLANSAQITPS